MIQKVVSSFDEAVADIGRVIVVMHHTTSAAEPKILRELTLT